MTEHIIATEPKADRARAGNYQILLIMAGIICAIGALGFAGWFANGDTLFWSLMQAGLAWCM